MKKKVTISCDPWFKDWCKSQAQGGYNVSRILVRAAINYYHLAPPDMKTIEEKIKNWPLKQNLK